MDIPGRDLGTPDLKDMRLAFRVRNLTNTVYAAFSDPGYQDQFYLGAPRTYEVRHLVQVVMPPRASAELGGRLHALGGRLISDQFGDAPTYSGVHIGC